MPIVNRRPLRIPLLVLATALVTSGFVLDTGAITVPINATFSHTEGGAHSTYTLAELSVRTHSIAS